MSSLGLRAFFQIKPAISGKKTFGKVVESNASYDFRIEHGYRAPMVVHITTGSLGCLATDFAEITRVLASEITAFMGLVT